MRISWATVIAATVGAVGGALVMSLSGVGSNWFGRSSDAGVAHAQDVVLCTSYALIDAVVHHPFERGEDVLPAIAPLRLALLENPDANPKVRAALLGAIEAYDAILAKDAKPHGLSEPPSYDPATVAAAFDGVAQVCGLHP